MPARHFFISEMELETFPYELFILTQQFNYPSTKGYLITSVPNFQIGMRQQFGTYLKIAKTYTVGLLLT